MIACTMTLISDVIRLTESFLPRLFLPTPLELRERCLSGNTLSFYQLVLDERIAQFVCFSLTDFRVQPIIPIEKNHFLFYCLVDNERTCLLRSLIIADFLRRVPRHRRIN